MKEDTHTADMPTYPETGDDPGVRPNHGSPPGIPRWVKVFGIVALILILLVAIIMFTGIGGQHGPDRHMRSGDAGGNTPPIEQGVQQP